VLDGELAVPCNPRSALAGLKVLQENGAMEFNRLPVSRDGPHVTSACEPRQIREEAAVSRNGCVVMVSIPRLRKKVTSDAPFDWGCTAKDFLCCTRPFPY